MKKKFLLPILFFATLLIWCFALAYPMQPDYDIWARLIVGKSVIENGIIFKRDFMSYTPTHMWYDHEWLTGAIFYYLSIMADFFKKTQIEMFSILKSILLFSIFAIAAICVKIREPKNSSPFQILYFILAAFSANVAMASTIRCHMFTFLFFTLFILILELFRKYKKYWILIFIPIIMLFWGNMHGGCISGLGLLLIYTVGEFLNKKNWMPYLLTLIVSFAFLFINPYGVEYVKFLFVAGTMNRSWISEWGSPFLIIKQTYKFITFFFFAVFIAILQPLVCKISYKNIDKTKLLLLIITGIIAVLHAKLLPFFVISATIFMFDDIYRILNHVYILKWINQPKNLIIYGLILFISASVINLNSKNRYGYINHAMYPYKAVEFIKSNSIVGNLFTEFSFGSYCVYKLYPQNKIFMDGRYEEVYNPKLLDVMKNFIRQEGSNPNSVLSNYPTDIVLLYNPPTKFGIRLNPSSKMQKVFNALDELKWKKIYQDECFVIYVRPDYPQQVFSAINYEPLKTSLSMFDTDLTKELLYSAAKKRIDPFSPNKK